MYEMGDAVKPEPEPEIPGYRRIPGTEPKEVPFNSMPSVGGSPRPSAPAAQPVAPVPQSVPAASTPAPQQQAAPKSGPMDFTF